MPKQPCGLDGKELLLWKYSKVVFQWPFKESPVTLILANLSDCSQVLLIILHLRMEHQMEIQVAHEGEAVERHRVANKDKEATGTSSEISRIEH